MTRELPATVEWKTLFISGYMDPIYPLWILHSHLEGKFIKISLIGDRMQISLPVGWSFVCGAMGLQALFHNRGLTCKENIQVNSAKIILISL